MLASPVTKEEVLVAFKQVKRNKSPGPDGFNIEFFHSAWHIMGESFIQAMLSSFNSCIMQRAVNSTSIALIPKVQHPTTMKEFRPISLCTVMYKCITKLMANRLKLVMPSLIDKAQSAFVPGSSISDNITMAQELFRGYTRETGASKCALKIYLHKAFDSLH